MYFSNPVLGGELRGSLGKLPELPVTFLLGMRLFTDGYHVYSRLRGRLCKNNLGPPVYGVLHPWWFGKFNFFLPPYSLTPFIPSFVLLAPSVDCSNVW